MNASTRQVCVALALSATTAVLLAACGGGSDSGQAGGADGGAGDSSTATTDRPALNASMPMTRQLAITFPVPKPAQGSPPGAAAAIAAGRRACHGKTPVEVREEFIEAAHGLNEGQREMISELPHFEDQVSANFAAGQLAAGVYEATLPEKLKVAGYQGCVYELALQLRRELAKKQG